VATAPNADVRARIRHLAAEALACIQTPEARNEAENIAANHPSSLVRELTAAKIQSKKCSLADF
jgi:hypothetical protein